MSELKRLVCAFGFSIDGIKFAWRDEAAFRLEVVLSLLIIPVGFYLGHNGIERALLLGSWLLVPTIELVNTALEAITNYATKMERHELAKKTKDAGSAAVLLACILFLTIWACVLIG